MENGFGQIFTFTDHGAFLYVTKWILTTSDIRKGSNDRIELILRSCFLLENVTEISNYLNMVNIAESFFHLDRKFP